MVAGGACTPAGHALLEIHKALYALLEGVYCAIYLSNGLKHIQFAYFLMDKGIDVDLFDEEVRAALAKLDHGVDYEVLRGVCCVDALWRQHLVHSLVEQLKLSSWRGAVLDEQQSLQRLKEHLLGSLNFLLIVFTVL